MKTASCRRFLMPARFNYLIFIGIFALALVVIAVPIHSAHSNSLERRVMPGPISITPVARIDSGKVHWSRSFGLPLSAPPVISETIETFASDCTTPKTDFDLGQTVCAKVTNAPVGAGGAPAQRLTWVARNGAVAQAGNITSSTQTGTYLLPTTATQTLGGVTIDNRGTWRGNTSAPSDGSLRNTAPFTVPEPTGKFPDL